MIPIAGLLCPFVFVAILVFVVFNIVRSFSRGGIGLGNRAANISTELAADGFWLTPGPMRRGSIIHFHYWSGGVRYNGQVPYQPSLDGRQFVYTGLTPEQVVILSVALPGGGMSPVFMPSIDDGPDLSSSGPVFDPPDSSGPAVSSTQFPSAY